MMLSRRKFIALGALLGLTLGYGGYKWRWGEAADVIVAVLKRRVGYLRVDANTFYEFAQEYVVHRQRYQRQFKLLSAFSLPLQILTPYAWLRQGHSFRRMEDNIVSLYLLSTDFFHNDSDEEREVHYVAFYDPYTSPCRNPFARAPSLKS